MSDTGGLVGTNSGGIATTKERWIGEDDSGPVVGGKSRSSHRILGSSLLSRSEGWESADLDPNENIVNALTVSGRFLPPEVGVHLSLERGRQVCNASLVGQYVR